MSAFIQTPVDESTMSSEGPLDESHALNQNVDDSTDTLDEGITTMEGDSNVSISDQVDEPEQSAEDINIADDLDAQEGGKRKTRKSKTRKSKTRKSKTHKGGKKSQRRQRKRAQHRKSRKH